LSEPTPSHAGEAPAPVPLRRNRDFVLLWSGQVVSTVGTRVSSLAFPLLVLSMTGSPAQAGIVAFAQTLPYLLFYLPAGALVDRWDRKRIMLGADAGRAVALGSVALVLAVDEPSMAQLIVVAFVEGSLFVLFDLSESAALPQIVRQEQLPAAIAQNQARRQGAELVGQPLGGLLFGLSRLLPFAFDAVSYAVSFVSLLFVRRAFQQRRQPSGTHLAAELREGVTWLARQPFLRTLVGLVAVSNYAFQALVLVLIVRARELGASPALIGGMLAFFGGAAILGSLAAPWMQRRLPASVVLVGALWLWAALTAVLVLIHEPLALGAVAGVASFAGPPFNVIVGSYAYAIVPDRLLGRVRGVALMVAWGAIPLGSLSAGFLVEKLGSGATLLVLAAIMLAIALAATSFPVVRRAPRVEALVAARDAA
jgi:predicted MFS family arabinose efflux permease